VRSVLVVALAACGGAAANGPTITLRAACGDHQYWTGTACAPAGDAPASLERGAKAIAEQDAEAAKAAVAAAEKAGPLDHASNVKLWEERGIALAFGDDEAGAKTAFDMMLALDPGHVLSYRLSPTATLPFEDARKKAAPPPALDVNWPRGGKVGDALPLDIEVVADPKQFLHHATVFVRARGEASWRAADLPLGGVGDRRIVLPPVAAQKPVSLELYLRAYDAHDNEVLTWADAARPREIALRYEAPTPWYKNPWVLAIGGGVLAIATGVTVYELVVAPPSTIGGGVMVTK
jgi:hypothetical protein